ncbi:histidine phosphatase family protein [Janthinobacterium agaricidamnosum]|uniref:Phosphoglycerate mutase family protein n=1 Tax=Janthinobacterium agaricidamnosum NBRC 102515 = DSM 9628 TaxID=1349767 RepID=W0VBE3_9BURK|nr:histidine phosphatase family protein [Janthinobacterium agaricidamnosum]CDG85201.1 phosphoglycerate mutase family protein [Janthinobacterium agaricidamnosum NBRC 102515 = DSM 9628]
MSTSIILIRHGETPWNAERRLQGHIDIPLNQEGQRQADAMARALADAPLSVIVASDLQRARQTALALAGHHGLPVHSDIQLRERCYGAFEGLLYADIERQYPAEYAEWQARQIDAVMPSGERVAESFRQFSQRCVSAIAAWAARHDGETIALVAHGGVLECAYRAALGMSLDSPRDFQVKNASINRFSYSDGRLSLLQWGDVAHLSAAAMDELA